MNQRIRDAEHERAQEVNPRLLEEIQELGRRLLYISAAEEVKFPRQPLWADDPRLLVAKLEASARAAAGCWRGGPNSASAAPRISMERGGVAALHPAAK